MKCTACGSENLRSVSLDKLFELQIVGDASLTSTFRSCVYLCETCGHLEFYDAGIRYLVNEMQTQILKLESEINNLEKQKRPLKNLLSVENELSVLRKEVNDPNITVKRQQELYDKIQQCEQEQLEESNNLSKNNPPIQKQITEKYESIQRLKKRIEDFYND